METRIAIFRQKKIRKTIFKDEWWFSVVDVIEALTDSGRPSVYWTAMKARVKNEDDFQLSTICRQLKFLAPEGKIRKATSHSKKSHFRV
jgi:Fe2+ or Zn2+ uptake regulation protein